jgi:uncharacterized protein with PQ loop repeat
MQFVDAVALCGALVSAAISIPQFWLVVRTKRTHGLSLTTWIISLGTNIGWLNHGIKLGEISMIWPNIWGLTVVATVLYFLRRDGRFQSYVRLLPGLGLGALLVSMDHLVGSAAFGMIVVVPQAFGMVKQGIALMRARQVTGVSVSAWGLQVVNQIIWLGWAVMSHDPGTLISAAVCLGSASFVLTWRILRLRGRGPVEFPPRSWQQATARLVRRPPREAVASLADA